MCLGVELGPTHYGTNTHCGFLRKGAEVISGPETELNVLKKMHDEIHNLYSSSNYGEHNE
jgi:hypothetical protein